MAWERAIYLGVPIVVFRGLEIELSTLGGTLMPYGLPLQRRLVSHHVGEIAEPIHSRSNGRMTVIRTL